MSDCRSSCCGLSCPPALGPRRPRLGGGAAGLSGFWSSVGNYAKRIGGIALDQAAVDYQQRRGRYGPVPPYQQQPYPPYQQQGAAFSSVGTVPGWFWGAGLLLGAVVVLRSGSG